MADAVPEKVKTMYLGVYGCDRFVSAYQDGLFRQDILTSWAMENAGREIRADYLTSAAFRPQIHVDEQLWGGILPWYRDWILNTDRDCSYWTEGFWADLKKIPGKIQIPLYIREGWYDHHLGSAISTYELLSDTAKSQSTFEIGPWNHSYQSVIAHQQTTGLKDNSFVKPLEWFDCILRKGGHPKRTIRRYVIGADCWEVQTVYPVPIDCKTCFYLDATDGKKGLVTSIPVTNACVEYDYDPLDPVFSYGAESLLKSMDKAGSLVQPPSDYRSDVLSFESEPLEKSLQIDGIIRVKLYVASDVEDTAFSVKLMEVFADGTAVNIRGIITTLAYRNGSATRRDYNPGEKVEIELSLWDIAWVLQAGSRLRLDVSSSDFPQYAVHSNYPGIWSEQVETRIAHQTIYTGNFSPSCIELPVVIAEE